MSDPRANKALGQHFLKDSKVIDSICHDFTAVASSLIEIGPGPGALTTQLHQQGKPLLVIERDQRFITDLQNLLGADQVIHQDALEVDLEKIILERDYQSPIWLVSNLPYNVSTPLLVKFIQCPSLRYMTLMFQKEVAQKVFDFSKSKNPMGSLMALTLTYFEAKLLCQVPPGAFNPPPEVNSTVLSFSRIEHPKIPLSNFLVFERFLRQLFQHKRKQSLSILKAYFPEPRLRHSFHAVGIKAEQRAESFTLEQVQDLFMALTEDE
jgi:16S rRNA (adenine1518-N6/adenine1519-N6)-dimethyltransferase